MMKKAIIKIIIIIIVVAFVIVIMNFDFQENLTKPYRSHGDRHGRWVVVMSWRIKTTIIIIIIIIIIIMINKLKTRN